jgi:hypothetical protein
MFASWGGLLHFYLYRHRYQAIVQQVVTLPSKEEQQNICSGNCWIRSSEPLQVGFHYAHGFLNWHDIVHDPSGKVTKPEFPSYGYLVYSDHLSGNWYLCHFSD